MAQGALRDPRVRFDTGTARRMLQLGGEVDRVVCNSAIWLDQNILVPPKAAEVLMQGSGKLCFSIPAEYLGHHEHWETARGREVRRTLQRLRAPFVEDAGGDAELIESPHQEYLGSVERMSNILKELNYKEVQAQLFTHEWSVGDYIDWIAQPVSLSRFCPAPLEAQRRFLEEVRGALNLDARFESRWFLVIAEL